MEKSTTTMSLSAESEIQRDSMHTLMKQPLKVQRFHYFSDASDLQYSVELLVEKEETLSAIYKTYKFGFGNNGLFLRSFNNKRGVTYHKKGKSSQRLKVWGLENQYTCFNLIKSIANKINPDTAHLFDNTVIAEFGTKGMYGYIIAGNITNTVQATEYYIRYSLRGVGLKQEHAPMLYAYLTKFTGSKYHAISALRIAVNPIMLIRTYALNNQPTFLTNIICYESNDLIRLAQATGEKIDWVNPNFNRSEEEEKLNLTFKKVKDFLQLWEGGPKFRDSSPVNHIGHLFNNQLPF